MVFLIWGHLTPYNDPWIYVSLFCRYLKGYYLIPLFPLVPDYPSISLSLHKTKKIIKYDQSAIFKKKLYFPKAWAL